jgi:C1A family cysteine protease
MNGFNGYVYASYKDSNDDFILFCNDHSHNAIDIENQMEAHYQKIMNGLYNKLESYRME